MKDQRPVLRIGFSPDPDDAFMWWPLVGGLNGGPAESFRRGRFRYEPVRHDIESLNRVSHGGELEITAMSCAQYPHVADLYVLTDCGASICEQQGPKIVSSRPLTRQDLSGGRVVLAVPGERTSAFAAAIVLLGPGSFRHAVVAFDQIISRVAAGEFEAGLVIHEGQLTFAQAGLHLIADLGMWWASRCGLPLPLGVNAVRRDLDDRYGPGARRQVASDLLGSIRYALSHRQEGLRHARTFARGTPAELVARYVDMYVNRWSLDLGPVGRAAVVTFLQEVHRAGLVPQPGRVEFIGSEG